MSPDGTGDDARRTEARLADPLLRLEDVTSGYGDTRVLRNVSFDVGDGETVGIVGRNGAGKTTTLQTIMGNVTPQSGSITFGGEEIGDLGPEATVGHGISFVPEERRIFPGLTVRENLELAKMGGSEMGVLRDIDEVIGMFENLAENESSLGSALSGGEQQMLAIARALVAGARLLLLDEPTEGLAPLIVERVQEVVEELSDEGLSILLVEQNVQVAFEATDYLYVLDNGVIVHQAPTEELREEMAILDRYLGVTT
jgi:branched-chain amino acid transport system ATP-binding protein